MLVLVISEISCPLCQAAMNLATTSVLPIIDTLKDGSLQQKNIKRDL
jgi:hypothetical protein